MQHVTSEKSTYHDFGIKKALDFYMLLDLIELVVDLVVAVGVEKSMSNVD